MKSSALSRAAIDRILALVGLIVVVLVIYKLDYPPLYVLILAFGILMIYVGTWRIIGQLLDRRANKALRAEIDQFTVLVRQLYAHRSKGNSAGVHEAKAALRDSLERVISAAGTYTEED